LAAPNLWTPKITPYSYLIAPAHLKNLQTFSGVVITAPIVPEASPSVRLQGGATVSPQVRYVDVSYVEVSILQSKSPPPVKAPGWRMEWKAAILFRGPDTEISPLTLGQTQSRPPRVLSLIARVLGYNKAVFTARKLHDTCTAAQILQKGTDIDAKRDGAKIEKETPSYKTPLHLVTLHLNVDFIRLLLDRGELL
jgi:hypothetical protein